QWLLALPVTHVAGLTVLVRSLDVRTRPEVLDLYGGFSVSAFVAATARLAPGVRHYTSLVPTQLRRLLDAGADLSSYRGVRVVAGHPGVAACAVVGRPDPEWGERVVAVVQPVDWSSAPDVESLRAFAAGSLDPAALPREVVTLGLLPVLDSGKPDKVAVRTLL